MIHVLAAIEIKPEHVPAFQTIFKENVPHVLAEEGCHGYEPTCDVETGFPTQSMLGPNRIMIIEKWESLDHLKAHLQAPHMKAYKEKTQDMTLGVTLQVTEAI